MLVIAEDYATLYKVNERWPGHAVLVPPALEAAAAHKFGSMVTPVILFSRLILNFGVKSLMYILPHWTHKLNYVRLVAVGMLNNSILCKLQLTSKLSALMGVLCSIIRLACEIVAVEV